jgi:Kef-type K+ transport system membrane component KefB
MSSQRHLTVIYVALLGATVLGFLLIRAIGEARMPTAPAAAAFGAHTSAPHFDILLHVLLGLAVVIVSARVLGLLFKHFGQPPVIGEVIAGILLGPSFLGHVAPGAAAYLMPPTVSQYFGVLAQIGVILYMFLVGLEVDMAGLRRGTQATIAISHASISVPFLLGAALALLIYPVFSTPDVPFTVFALFMGVSMSVTAFPVLARILTDRRLHKTKLGAIALMCAAVDDVTAWCLLAVVVSIVQARVVGSVITVLLTVLYIALIIVIARPAIARWSRHVDGDQGELGQPVTAAALVLLLVSALTTEYIGIHAIFGAFLLGVVFPHDGRIARELTHRLHDVVIVLLLPAFFAFTGMRTQIGLVDGPVQWLWCLGIIAVACLGKFGGSAAAARLTGMGWRDAAALGILMNTRGLVELIVLNIGLDLKVLSPTLFTMLVLMALVTTFMTTPILHLCLRVPSVRLSAVRPSTSTAP